LEDLTSQHNDLKHQKSGLLSTKLGMIKYQICNFTTKTRDLLDFRMGLSENYRSLKWEHEFITTQAPRKADRSKTVT
jgi:hypothetical protein